MRFMVLIAYATSEGSGEPAHPRSLARAFAVRTHEVMKFGSRRKVRPKIRHLAPLHGCACAFEERVYGGRNVPLSHEMAQLSLSRSVLAKMWNLIYRFMFIAFSL